jgi:hypothetical protein
VLAFDPARVARAVLEHKGGAPVTMARADGAWRVEGADGKKPKETVIGSFLDDLRELRGAEIAADPAPDLGAYGLDAPDLRATLTDKDGQSIGTVLAAKHDGKFYVMRAGTQTVFEARDYMYARLDKQQKDFVEEPGATTTTFPSAPEPGAEDLGGGAEEDEAD